MTSFIGGLLIGFSLILAIGSQNAFVLRQGLKKQYIKTICFICAISDTVLIFSGVFLLNEISGLMPYFYDVTRIIAFVFLFTYGIKKIYDSFYAKYQIDNFEVNSLTAKKVILICLAFTWLNPHVYLDTLIFLGSISVQYNDKLYFALGASMASFVFFYMLGFLSGKLSHLFMKPKSWKIIDFLIGIFMIYLSIQVVF